MRTTLIALAVLVSTQSFSLAAGCLKYDQKVTLTGTVGQATIPEFPARDPGKRGSGIVHQLLVIAPVCIAGNDSHEAIPHLTKIEPVCVDHSAFDDFFARKGERFALTGYLRENESPHIFGSVTIECE